MTLDISNLSFSYDTKYIFKNFNLTLQDGIYVIIGPNGSGKSTLLKILSTVLTPAEGKILLNHNDIYSDVKCYKSKIGYLPQIFGIYENYTVNEYLSYVGALKGLRPIVSSINIDNLLREFDLTKAKDKKIKKLSLGVQKKIGIIQALLNDPDIILLDEPTTNMDPKERNNLLLTMSSISANKIIIFTTHILKELETIPCNLIIMDNGCILYNNDIEKLKNNKSTTIENFYFSQINSSKNI